MTRRASTREPWYAPLRGASAEAAAVPCVHRAVTAALADQPQRTLLVDETRSLRNDSLLDAISRRARILRERAGGDAAVAVMLPNDVELAITYFACLRAGLRYLPLPSASVTVIDALLDHLQPALVVSSDALETRLRGRNVLIADHRAEARAALPDARVPLPEIEPDRPAHVLLTSGTETGMPKAVITDHRGSMLSHRWRAGLWPYDARDVVGCNIFGVWDLVPALLQGVPVVMLEDDTLRDPLALAAAVVRYGLTRLMLTPTLLDACLECADAITALSRLRLIVLCGEAVAPALMERAWQRLGHVRIANLYSLSECHDVAAGTLTPGGALHAGRVAPFADVHVVDPADSSRLLATGEAGRVLVGGQALAQGYLDPATTAARFFTVRFTPAAALQRVYDTGDLGRLGNDGSLEVLGRVDNDLKIRGAWVEPEAVTALLLDQPGVARAVAVAETAADQRLRLAAFVVAAAGAPTDLIDRLRARLTESLPPQSVPGRIELLDDLPLLPSGKIDRLRLSRPRRDPPGAHADSGRSGTAGALQQSVLTAFREVLKQPDAAPNDTFGDLGGDSLDAIALCGRLHAFTGKHVRVRDLQRHSTAAELARFLGTRPAARSAEHFLMPMDRLPGPADRAARPPQTVLVSGVTGLLGRRLLQRLLAETSLEVVALIRADTDAHAHARLESLLPGGPPPARLTALCGDLTQPQLGLPAPVWRDLAGRTDAVLHAAARADMFAGYESLAAVNVAGTRQLLELALGSGAAFLHISSSAVLPLGAADVWDESRAGWAPLEAIAAQLVHSDGYSQTKLAAEALAWQAAERGLPVTVCRLPHLVGHGHRGRLADTLTSLALLETLPEGPWHWQLADIGSVCERLMHPILEPPSRPRLLHLAAPPVSDRQIEAALGGRRPLSRLTLPALANRIARAAREPPPHWTRRQRASVLSLAQLTREYGVRAALCVDEPVLASQRPLAPDAVGLLLDSLPD